MKKTIRRILNIAISCALLLVVMVPMVSAAVQASDFFAFTDVVAIPTGSSNITVEAEINAKYIMQEVGVKSITIYEQQPGGNYLSVKSYTSDNTPSLITQNSAFSYSSLVYKGISGRNYYVSYVLYAKDSSGSEKLYGSTGVVTAK
ncbi:hypothetical protein [uncultured Oscillibacter sp.]|uniref:hypothetical protein n=1 Tax=uncultured Oscillibacter sp. TaxID=876091 RepID=UPI0025DA6463|nr:hypothetical protein [uncultured Oscillibacter sp.]